ncbi:LOW QUALITY PROTEIN: uncharacterized protein LOC120457174 [Drosophila santomea]|uniref:LOW QUALITY PROTEIN: uncharacterized protein LOC120457174 n=1 Tax=Drosophila santomea TaxID=129105 RepID=UPI001952D591|nr:LOW QUALITY PROTEIN: uncharacterized protein LOC120457174 [Drosophila santomea]
MSTESPNEAHPVEPVLDQRLALNRALVRLVQQARRLNFTSLEGYGSLEGLLLEHEVPELPMTDSETAHSTTTATSSARPCPKRKPSGQVRSAAKAIKLRKTDTHLRTPRGVQCMTAHLPVPPPPPPPSPRYPQARELDVALETADHLRIEMAETDALLDQLLYDAKALERQVAIQCQLQRDMELIRSLEMEYSGRSLRYLIEAIRSDCESEHVQELWRRCHCSLERHAERQLALESEEDSQLIRIDLNQDEGYGKGTQTDLSENEILPALANVICQWMRSTAECSRQRAQEQTREQAKATKCSRERHAKPALDSI